MLYRSHILENAHAIISCHIAMYAPTQICKTVIYEGSGFGRPNQCHTCVHNNTHRPSSNTGYNVKQA